MRAIKLLSIVIPVYNVEKYVETCVDSILCQDFSDYEIILVDDGSPDRCPEICDRYAQTDERITVIHQDNSGVAEARNAGIREARGEYIVFLDSDDYWNKEASLKRIVSTISEKKDIQFLLYQTYFMHNNELFLKNKEEFDFDFEHSSVTECYAYFIRKGNVPVAPYNKIFRTGFLKENNLYFVKGIVGEDTEWFFRIMRCVRRISWIDEPLVIFRYGREGSITNTIGTKNIVDLLTIINKSLDYYERINLNSEVKEYELTYCAYLWYICLANYYNLQKNSRKAIKEKMLENRRIKRYDFYDRVKIMNRAYAFWRFHITSLVLRNYLLRRSVLLKKSSRNVERIP